MPTPWYRPRRRTELCLDGGRITKAPRNSRICTVQVLGCLHRKHKNRFKIIFLFRSIYLIAKQKSNCDLSLLFLGLKFCIYNILVYLFENIFSKKLHFSRKENSGMHLRGDLYRSYSREFVVRARQITAGEFQFHSNSRSVRHHHGRLRLRPGSLGRGHVGIHWASDPRKGTVQDLCEKKKRMTAETTR